MAVLYASEWYQQFYQVTAISSIFHPGFEYSSSAIFCSLLGDNLGSLDFVLLDICGGGYDLIVKRGLSFCVLDDMYMVGDVADNRMFQNMYPHIAHLLLDYVEWDSCDSTDAAFHRDGLHFS